MGMGTLLFGTEQRPWQEAPEAVPNVVHHPSMAAIVHVPTVLTYGTYYILRES